MAKITATEALEILQRRGVKVSYPTFAMWVREGKFAGAEFENNLRGAIWTIPAESVENSNPPSKGRPPTRKEKAK